MKYRVECLTPLLAGDGGSLSPIDYMVWRDQVNVLDQKRIFRLLATREARLDGYLSQVKRAEKLDFASWGGFAQNFAGRRIPFEHSSIAGYWEKQRAEQCHIPTFAANHTGPYLPGSALRGALRTALVASRADGKIFETLAEQMKSDKPPRRPSEFLEQRALGREAGTGSDPLKGLAVGDSAPAAVSSFRVYLIRTATLVETKSKSLELGWRLTPRGTVDGRRAGDSTPEFAEMAVPGTVFEGEWSEREFFLRAETVQALHWRHALDRERVFGAANAVAGLILENHARYAAAAGLAGLGQTVAGLQARLAGLSESGSGCLLALGWGGGLTTKAGCGNVDDEAYRRLIVQHPLYAKAVRSGMPFPKTRRIVFEGNQPATLPGWVAVSIL